MNLRAALPVLIATLAPSLAQACAVCFGADGGNKALGAAFNIAVTMTLAITMGLLATGIVWFRRIERRRIAQDALTIARLDREDAAQDSSGWGGPAPTPAP